MGNHRGMTPKLVALVPWIVVACRGMTPKLVALVPWIVVACRGTPTPVRPAPVTGTTRYYQPLEMKRDAKLPGLAVILGSDDRNGSMVLPLPGTPRTVVVDAPFVIHDRNKPASGRLVAVTLTGAPNLPAAPSPATAPKAASGPNAPNASSEPNAPGASNTPGASNALSAPDASSPTSAPGLAAGASTPWQAALQSAAFVAATALGKDLADLTFSATPAVPSEDASASALIAVGFVATLTGDDIDPAATVTGQINPDGTLGPIAGIPEQLVAAIASGKTRIGVPGGMRIARSLASGRDVDLVQLARARRAEAIELATLHDAYRLMTHKALPAAVPVSEADMALDAETLDGLRTRYLAWQKRLASEWAPLLQLEQSGRLPAVVKRLVRLAHDRSAQAEALVRADKLAAAYRRLLTAWVYAASANDTYGVIAKLQAGDVGGAAAVLAALDAADASAGGIVARIGELRPTTLPGHLAMIAALHTALRGSSYRAFAVESLRAAGQLVAGFRDKPRSELTAPSTADAVAGTIAPAAVMAHRAIAELTIAEQELALAPDRGVPYACSPTSAKRLADAFRAASITTVGYLDTLLVEPVARRASAPEDAVRRHVAADEPDTLVATQLSSREPARLVQDFAAAWADGAPAAILLPLASYQLAYHSAASLAARHGSFTVHRGDTGKVDSVEPAEAFRNLLASARRSALGAARAARIATGEIPAQARLAYQLAAVDAAGDLADQLDALAELWTASAFSNTAVMLARN